MNSLKCGCFELLLRDRICSLSHIWFPQVWLFPWMSGCVTLRACLPSSVSERDRPSPTCPPTAWLRSPASVETRPGQTAGRTQRDKNWRAWCCKTEGFKVFNLKLLYGRDAQLLWLLTSAVNSYLCFREGDPAETGFELGLQLLQT